MSRLFSRLENLGQDQTEHALPAEPAPQPDAHAGFSAADSSMDMAPPIVANPLTVQPLVPGYAISSSLSMPSPGSVAATTRPVWPVRLWLASLVLLVVLSALMLAMPARLLPLAQQQQQRQAAPDVAAQAPSSPSASPPAAARRPTVPSASAVVAAVPAAPAPRTASAAAAPSDSAAGPACSESMLAMSLCSKSSP